MRQQPKFFVWGLDYEGDISIYVVGFTLTWFHNRCMWRWGNKVVWRQNTDMSRQLKQAAYDALNTEVQKAAKQAVVSANQYLRDHHL